MNVKLFTLVNMYLCDNDANMFHSTMHVVDKSWWPYHNCSVYDVASQTAHGSFLFSQIRALKRSLIVQRSGQSK